MWLDKPLVQIPALPCSFSPGVCTTSLLKSSKGLWTMEDHSISWGAFRCPLGSLCLPGHPHTWCAKFSSVCFPQCHHFKVIPLLCMYCLLQTVVTPATKPLMLSAVRRYTGTLWVFLFLLVLGHDSRTLYGRLLQAVQEGREALGQVFTTSAGSPQLKQASWTIAR